MAESLPFIDLKAQRRRLEAPLKQAIDRVLEHGAFIMGPEVAQLEAALAQRAGTRIAITCASGTDALALILLAWGIGQGDAVYVPAFTFVATAEVVAWTGATPVFVDVLPDTFNMDPASLERAIAAAPRMGLTPRAVIPVDLFGQPVDYAALLPVAERHGLKVLDDAAQAFGASLNGRPIGSFGNATATSFFPAKPLGCYGDGGAVFLDDAAVADVILSLRIHGQGKDKYDNVRVGLNGRLDTIQAAVLLQKLTIFDDEIRARNRIAARYNEGLKDLAQTPELIPGATSVWAQYTILLPNRDAVAARLKAAGIPTAIYYPIPLHRQTGYHQYPCGPGGVPVSDDLSGKVLSLPMHPYLDEATQDRIIAAVRDARH
ncbi:MAG TPA: DegT/DnrJ/EryC1/StrS family aminotransferase [bacterium]|nr:DegT/DnrJ/EryC1/StrS family aminotransferase [bacterium]